MSVSVTELVIIESLATHEPQTGAILNECLTLGKRLPIPSTLVKTPTAERFFALIEHMRTTAERTNGAWVPMIHLEIHGHVNREGLVLASREFVSWQDLAPHFRALNVSVRNSIVAVLGVCSGAFALTAAANSPFDPSPFYGLIGPDRPVPGVLLPDAFEAFYVTLLETGDFVPAVNILRSFIPAYGGYDTATLFRLGWRQYVELCAGDPLQVRVDNILGRTPQSEIIRVGGVANARAVIAAQVQATVQHRDHHYQRFIMTDRYPEISDRFPAIGAA